MDSFFTMRRILLLAVVMLVFSQSCTRISSTDIGSGLIPAVDGVNTFDTTFSVITDSYDDLDTVRVYKSDNHVLGAITNDPLFGKTTGKLFFQVSAESYPFATQGSRDSIKIDSAVLILSYHGSYGDSTQPLKLNVYEMKTKMDPFLNYPANYPLVSPLAYYPTPLGPTKTVDIRRLGDSVINRFETATSQIRIKLNSSFAKRMILDYDSSNAYKSDSLFLTYFAGLAVIPDAIAPANVLVNINLADTNTKLALYYNTASTGATARDTVVTYLKFNSSTSANANIILRDRTGSEVVKHLSPTPKSDSLLYIQSQPGTGVRIKVPGLQSLTNRIIHRAELIAEQVPDDARLILESQLTPPRYLLLSLYDSLNRHKTNIPNDYIYDMTNGPNITDMGGFIGFKSIQGYNRVGAYWFNLSRYVQGIISRKDTSFNMILTAPSNDSLYYSNVYPNQSYKQITYLSPGIGNDVANGRVRLGGGTHTRFRMRLRIVYSKI